MRSSNACGRTWRKKTPDDWRNEMDARGHTDVLTAPPGQHDDTTVEPIRTRTGAVLVTGAAGWLGGEILRQLQAGGWSVAGTDLVSPHEERCASFRVADLRDAAFCRDIVRGARVVIHCAARQYHEHVSARARESVFAENVTMTQALVDAVAGSEVEQFIYVSSDMVYGTPRQSPVREDGPNEPLGPYGRSKLLGEKLCGALEGGRCRVAVLRPRVIIGPGRLGILRKLFDAVRAGRMVPVFGDGENRFQLVSCADVARACLLAMEQRAAGCFNLGSAAPVTINELLAGLIARAGSKSRLLHVPTWAVHWPLRVLDWAGLSPMAPEQYLIADANFVVDTTRARELLGWEPTHNDIDTLWQTYTAYVSGETAR